ncbi:MAG: hypothetical protein CL916_06960 [Deltaproteobacteria bacterium]|nr:hypothetical protein [Deltaproteobacteria bacterium]
MTPEPEEQSDRRRPIFFGASVVTFTLSFLSQIYFFVILNGILSKKENAMDVIQAILEWMLLLAPSLGLASILFVLFVIFYGVSWYRHESTHRFMIPFGFLALVDAAIFLLVFTFGYQP